MPVTATLVMHFVVGMLAARLAAHELRASPRPFTSTQGFFLTMLHALCVSLPTTTYILIRMPDWAFSYVFEASQLPSVVIAGIVVLHLLTIVAGFSLGAHLVRTHHAMRPFITSALFFVALLVATVVFRRRILMVATALQIRTGEGAERLFDSAWLRTIVSLGACWTASAVHLGWRVSRAR